MASHIGRRKFLATLGGAAAAWPLAARAQQGGKKYTIGLFSAGIRLPENAPAWIAFLSAMRELGWIEGKNVVFEGRYADNRLERLPALAEELVRLNVDVIVAIGTLAPLAAKRATSTIPIVMAAAGDPLGSGLVASLAQPGGNVTGMSLMAPDLGGKRLELLKELVPRLARVAVLWNAANPYSANVFKETQVAGRVLGVQVQSLGVRNPEDLDGAFEAARQQHPDALVSGRPFHCHIPKTHYGLRDRRPFAVALWTSRRCERWRPRVVRSKSRGVVPACSRLCRQNPQGCQACRSSRSAADHVRTGS
jgi:putative tryptophan/tyrosine transport system substrate-binding protein